MYRAAAQLKRFFSGFGLPAYQEGTVPDDAVLPYITYSIAAPEWNQKASMFARVGLHWDGKTGQTNFGQEVETLINQGTQFRVLKVTRKGRTGKIYVDLEIINQDHKQRWHP